MKRAKYFIRWRLPAMRCRHDKDWEGDIQKIMDTVNSKVLAERERCEKIVQAADARSICYHCDYDEIVAAIRSGE